MVRWRFVLVLALLLLMPMRIGSNSEEDDMDDERDDGDEETNNNEDEDDDDDDISANKDDSVTSRRSSTVLTMKTPTTRTYKKRLLECFVCAYKSETPLRACLDPTKYRVHTITCHSADDKCFTTVIQKGSSSYEAIVRGCRSNCIGSLETTCCEMNKCNSQAFALPIIQPQRLKEAENKSDKSLPPTVMFFVTILLTLQAVVKVTLI